MNRAILVLYRFAKLGRGSHTRRLRYMAGGRDSVTRGRGLPEAVARIDHKLHEAAEHHGWNSPQVQQYREELERSRDYCWQHEPSLVERR